ncbi:hypothetical protein NDU88_007457 [Pleurodeles waltl]|uniref:Uncharacterized protein n=1 Tax=Pleurodeles waltl TaxID=8319 RepID=A0AAV7RU66_PLEWA|nr:hypothetical protein NDU88_007457 [Pleurodeles waltl]
MRSGVFFWRGRWGRAGELAEQTGSDTWGKTAPRRDSEQPQSEAEGRLGGETEQTDQPRSGRAWPRQVRKKNKAGNWENRDLD